MKLGLKENEKNDLSKNVEWISRTNYTVSINWVSSSQGCKAYHSADPKNSKEVLIGNPKIFKIPQRRFIVSHSRGGLATLGAIIYNNSTYINIYILLQ